MRYEIREGCRVTLASSLDAAAEIVRLMGATLTWRALGWYEARRGNRVVAKVVPERGLLTLAA